MNKVFPRFPKRAMALFVALSATFSAIAQSKTPSFENVYKLLQENATGLSAEQLNAAAVRGLLAELGGRASLTTNALGETVEEANLVSQASVFDKSYAYLRVGRVESGLSDKLAEEYRRLSGTNKLQGVILDLRFADGSDYSAAGRAADLFVNGEQPLVNWGAGSVSSNPKTTAISLPTAILINNRTRGAAEALAAALREARVGLLIGGPSAGQASVFKEFPLEGGHTLRIASSPVRVGKDRVLSSEGLTPDIQLQVSLEDERAYLEDPYRVISRPISQVALTLSTNALSATDTNRPRTRINEAELVRRKREGVNADEEYIDQPAVVGNELR
ncbi:MAG: S41 family peptidase, partial [Limisphaerales bacterium]